MSDEPPVVHAVLGSELREARQKIKISTRSAASHIGLSHPTLVRIETGKRPVATEELLALCGLYGITGTHRDHMLDRARSSPKPTRARRSLPPWSRQLAKYNTVEPEATRITYLNTLFVPGMLQTPEYMHEVVCDGVLSEGDEDWTIRTRLSRQSLLYKSNGPHLRMLIDEPVLRRPVGGAEVMSDQLEQITKLSRHSNITVQVIPFSVGEHAGLHGGPFLFMEFPDRPAQIHSDARSVMMVLDDPDEVRPFVTDLELLNKVLLNEHDSRQLIQRIQKEFQDGRAELAHQ